MANRIMLNETSYHGAGAIEEEDWYESQPIQLSTGKFAISIRR